MFWKENSLAILRSDLILVGIFQLQNDAGMMPAQAAMHDPGFRTTELGRCIIRFVHFFDVLYQRVLGGNCGAAFPPLCTTAHFPCKMLAGAAGRVSHLQTTMMHFTMYIVS